jgi:hypothetical protein
MVVNVRIQDKNQAQEYKRIKTRMVFVGHNGCQRTVKIGCELIDQDIHPYLIPPTWFSQPGNLESG